ncbi:unnamed protein product [Vicia faba]|uniref:TPX2 central domain-containing protein n=1 Tax=Vicia faba TaxID=3906 RepID=A0AAV1ACS6_VICFA|nr:unnamed protein product [Vicia faba]
MVQNNMKGRIDRFECDREEELSFFRELKKRQNEYFPNLCASEEYECDTNYGGNGKFSLYRIPSGKKESGLELLETKNKSDFDWLKTPPATPLFPSLEMEPNAKLVVQKELPIAQFISNAQFAKNDVEENKPKANQTNSIKSSKLPMRSITPSYNRQRPNMSKNTSEYQLGTHPTTTKKEHDATNTTKSPNPKKQINNVNFISLNQKKSIEANEPQRKLTRTRGVSPSMKSKGSNIAIELSNETPQNLRTDKRSTSNTRGRSITRGSLVGGFQNQDITPKNTRGRSMTKGSLVGGFQNQDPTPKACRPSRSPSPSMSKYGLNQFERTQKNEKKQKEIFTLGATSNENRSNFKGSKMVERVVNARKFGSNHADKETTLKPINYRVS